jgi:hypothetical protein
VATGMMNEMILSRIEDKGDERGGKTELHSMKVVFQNVEKREERRKCQLFEREWIWKLIRERES